MSPRSLKIAVAVIVIVVHFHSWVQVKPSQLSK